MKTVLVKPSMNSVSERSFSVMRITKTYLRSSMSQNHLNDIITLHLHKDKTVEIRLQEIAK